MSELNLKRLKEDDIFSAFPTNATQETHCAASDSSGCICRSSPSPAPRCRRSRKCRASSSSLPPLLLLPPSSPRVQKKGTLLPHSALLSALQTSLSLFSSHLSGLLSRLRHSCFSCPSLLLRESGK